MTPIFSRFKPKETFAISVNDFQSLFEQFYPGIVRQLYFITQDKDAAEDIAQETFIRLYHSCPISLKNPGAWLGKVAANLAYNYLKEERNRRGREAVQDLTQSSENETSEDIVVRREESVLVKQVVNTLPVKERMCLLLRFSGFSYEEIADALQIPKSSVGKTIARAQQKFKGAYLRKKGSDSS